MTVKTIKKLNDMNFKDFISQSTIPVVVDFCTEWSAPCKQIGFAFEELLKKFADKVTLAKLDIDSSPIIAAKYEVISIPTMWIFKKGQPVATKVGAMSKAKIAEWIEENTKVF